MKAETLVLKMPGEMLKRGFWLYVWRIKTPKGVMLYVGRTGDSSSPRANPPYLRMGQHLGNNEKQNALRRQLLQKGVKPEDCVSFELISHGPLFPEKSSFEAHKRPRDIVAALEKQLRDSLYDAGYKVLNTVNCRKKLDNKRWRDVHAAFVKHFPKMKTAKGLLPCHLNSCWRGHTASGGAARLRWTAPLLVWEYGARSLQEGARRLREKRG